MSRECTRWRNDIGAYAVGALEADEPAAVSRHLAGCPACRAEYQDLLPVVDWLNRTKQHLTACRPCRADYEELLLPGPPGCVIAGW
jgi:predicted anti-sigma-YlaC factor YlaD